MHPRRKHKGSDLDTNQKLLKGGNENNIRYYYTADDDSTVHLNVRQQTVVITNNSAFTLVLPSVAEADGLSYSISVTETGQAVTLTDLESDSVSWGGDYTLDAAGDSIKLLSTGQSWSVLNNNIS